MPKPKQLSDKDTERGAIQITDADRKKMKELLKSGKANKGIPSKREAKRKAFEKALKRMGKAQNHPGN